MNENEVKLEEKWSIYIGVVLEVFWDEMSWHAMGIWAAAAKARRLECHAFAQDETFETAQVGMGLDPGSTSEALFDAKTWARWSNHSIEDAKFSYTPHNAISLITYFHMEKSMEHENMTQLFYAIISMILVQLPRCE